MPGAVTSPAREASRARRAAMAARGKVGINTLDLPRMDSSPAQSEAVTSREKSGCGCGCKGKQVRAEDSPGQNTKQNSVPRPAQQKTKPASRKITNAASMGLARAASRARRKAMSSRGKAGLNPNGESEVQTAGVANPNMASRDIARAVRTQRSLRGGAGMKTAEPCGRQPGSRMAAGPSAH